MTRFSSTLRSVRGDERGVGAIELALLAPLLALLTVGMVDLTQGVTRRSELHDAVHRTLEKVAARQFKLTNASGGLDTAYLVTDAADGGGVTEEEVTVTAWLECDGEDQGPNSFNSDCPPLAAPDPGCGDPAPPPGAKCVPILARYVRVRIDTTYSPSFGKVVLTDQDGKVPLFAEAAVRVQ